MLALQLRDALRLETVAQATGPSRIMLVLEGGPDTAVAVNYRDVWFYVDDADLDSKCTFDMLTQLMALQAGDIRSTLPVLTIPVSRQSGAAQRARRKPRSRSVITARNSVTSLEHFCRRNRDCI